MNRNYRRPVVGMPWAISLLLEKEMGLSAVQLGLLGSSFAWVYGLGGQFARNHRREGRRYGSRTRRSAEPAALARRASVHDLPLPQSALRNQCEVLARRRTTLSRQEIRRVTLSRRASYRAGFTQSSRNCTCLMDFPSGVK